jgi:hypothetical protein
MPVGSGAADRLSSVVERLAHEFEQVYARLRWARAAGWDGQEHVDDVLALLTLRFGLWLERCASPRWERLGFRRARRHAQELHVLRQGVAELACYGVEFFAVGEDFHVVVDEIEQRLPFGLWVVVELHLAGAVQQDCRGDESDVSAGVSVWMFDGGDEGKTYITAQQCRTPARRGKGTRCEPTVSLR